MNEDGCKYLVRKYIRYAHGKQTLHSTFFDASHQEAVIWFKRSMLSDMMPVSFYDSYKYRHSFDTGWRRVPVKSMLECRWVLLWCNLNLESVTTIPLTEAERLRLELLANALPDTTVGELNVLFNELTS